MKDEDAIYKVPKLVEKGLEVKEETVVASELEGIARVRLEVIQSLL